jgi:hypothetical protein
MVNLLKGADVRTCFARSPAPTVDGADVARVTIDVLPDVALLEIFDFYVDNPLIDSWHTLVHVCRNWRNLVFGSPRRLNLRLHCKDRTRVVLDVWPLLPIVLELRDSKVWRMDDIIAALEHNDRICQLVFFDILSNWQFEKVLEAMQRPFPSLTRLHLAFEAESDLYPLYLPAIPTSFLVGFAPCLQTLILDSIPLPELPSLLLSITHLVSLDLRNISLSGYISPEAMATALSVLTRLERLRIELRSYIYRESQRLPLPTRNLLPALTELRFKGVSKYLEDLVARVDTPLLDSLAIIFRHQLHQLISDNSELTQLISRTPNFHTHHEAHVVISNQSILVTLPQTFDRVLELGISYNQLKYWQLSILAQVCSSLLQALFPAVEQLYITGDRIIDWEDDLKNSYWLELLHPFTAVKSLYIPRVYAADVASALQELVGERVKEVLPALQTLFLEEPLPPRPIREAIGQFVSARQLASLPVAVSHWKL